MKFERKNNNNKQKSGFWKIIIANSSIPFNTRPLDANRMTGWIVSPTNA